MIYSMYTGFGQNVDALGIDRALDIAAEYGFSGVEFFYPTELKDAIPPYEQALEYRKKIEERGFCVSCVSMGASIVRPHMPNEISRDDIDGLIRGVEFAAAVGSRFFHHTIFMGFGYEIPDDFRLDDKRELFLEGARQVVTYAAELGVEVLYEPQGPFFNGYDEFCSFVYDMRRTHKNIGVCCDFGNSFWVGQQPYAIFEELAPLIRHIHMKDYVITSASADGAAAAFRGGVYIREVPIGDGCIDLSRIAGILNGAGYDGAASLEDFPNVQSADKTKNIIERLRTVFG